MIESNFLLTREDSVRFLSSLLYGPINGVWKDEKGSLYVGGNFVFINSKVIWKFVDGIPGNNFLRTPPTMGFVQGIFGLHFNDVIIVGQRSFIMHFNGRKWERIGFGYQAGSPLSWGKVHIKGNFAMTAGSVTGKGIVMRMYR